MNTGQTILALGALMLLTSIMLNFYRIFGDSWGTVEVSQIGIDGTTLATSYFEIAHGLAFDAEVLGEAGDTVCIFEPEDLTPPGSGKWGPGDITDIEDFSKFDDFDGFIDTTTVDGVGTYVASFDVNYVDPADVQTLSMDPTYTKRMNIKVWRTNPPVPSHVSGDTIRMWTVMGYFSFQECD